MTLAASGTGTCMGCRYCSYACPFGVPQFDLSQWYGRINKCEMCSHLQAKGGIPACCSFLSNGDVAVRQDD